MATKETKKAPRKASGKKKPSTRTRKKPAPKKPTGPEVVEVDAEPMSEGELTNIIDRMDRALVKFESAEPKHVAVEGVTIYHQLESLNETSVLALLTGMDGEAIDSLVYEWDKVVEGDDGSRTLVNVRKLSLAGIETCTLLMGAISCPIEKMRAFDTDDDWFADVQAIDLRTGASRIGSGSSPKFKNNKKAPFARRTAIHIAQRNAEAKLIPRPIIEHLIQRAAALGRVTVIDNPQWSEKKKVEAFKGGGTRSGSSGQQQPDPDRLTRDKAAMEARAAFFAEFDKVIVAALPVEHRAKATDAQLGALMQRAFLLRATEGQTDSYATLSAESVDALRSGLIKKRQSVLKWFRSGAWLMKVGDRNKRDRWAPYFDVGDADYGEEKSDG